MGADRVLIAAPAENAGAASAGAVYLFSTDGELLATLTQPTPTEDEYFGSSLAVVGTNQVLIGTPFDSTGASAAGAAYLLNAVAPTSSVPALTIGLTTTNTLALSWPSSSPGWVVQENTNGLASADWSNASGTFEDDGTDQNAHYQSSDGELLLSIVQTVSSTQHALADHCR